MQGGELEDLGCQGATGNTRPGMSSGCPCSTCQSLFLSVHPHLVMLLDLSGCEAVQEEPCSAHGGTEETSQCPLLVPPPGLHTPPAICSCRTSQPLLIAGMHSSHFHSDTALIPLYSSSDPNNLSLCPQLGEPSLSVPAVAPLQGRSSSSPPWVHFQNSLRALGYPKPFQECWFPKIRSLWGSLTFLLHFCNIKNSFLPSLSVSLNFLQSLERLSAEFSLCYWETCPER